MRPRRLLAMGTVGAFLAAGIIWANPVSSTFYRAGLLAAIAAGWAGLLVLFWRRRLLRWSLLTVPVACVFLVATWPGGPIEPVTLRADYVRRLEQLQGTPYFWGGEKAWGIDCSGLPRKALRDALLAYGIRHANGDALRDAIAQWWFDASARALGEGYRKGTVRLPLTGTIRAMDDSQLQPGDLAVTTNGVHVLVYMGQGEWIQADPSAGRVILLNGKSDPNTWFRTPVTTHRWSYFTDSAEH